MKIRPIRHTTHTAIVKLCETWRNQSKIKTKRPIKTSFLVEFLFLIFPISELICANRCVFFFVFFFSQEKFTCHSFIRFQSCFFFFRPRKKKTTFSCIHPSFPRNAQKRTYPGKKIRYLCSNPKSF